mgnify:CR=1 FL=1
MDAYGLVGYPLGHSFSAGYFAEKFAREGIAATYTNFEIPDIAQFASLIAERPNLRGVNVTIPHKQAVIPLLDALSNEAQEIGAVNVVRILRDKDGGVRTKGFNSDVIGFVNSITPLLKSHHRRALVLGSGGASKAVVFGLKKLGIVPTYVSRTKRTAALTYEEVAGLVMGYNPWDLGLQMHQVAIEPLLDKMGIEYDPKAKYKGINGKDLGTPINPINIKLQ